jgi:hypothetical protein
LRNRRVRVIAVIVVLGEVFGFSSLTVLPTIARDVLFVDATGLGAMTAARATGGLAAGLYLATVGFRGGGLAMVVTAAVFGASLVALAASGSLGAALGSLLFLGGAAASLDTIGQALVQRSVDDTERGSAMGVWFFAVGFGPIGFVSMGIAASAVGAPAALAASGILLFGSGLVIGSFAVRRGLT